MISFPFPDSNTLSKIGYNSFYSQLVRFFRLCNSTNDFCIRVKLLYTKLHQRGYSKCILIRYFLKFCSRYPIDIRYGITDGDTLRHFILQLWISRSCNVFDYEAIDEAIKPCSMVLDELYPGEVDAVDSDVSLSESSYSEPHTLDVQMDEVTDDMTRNMGIVPQPLSNPRNHCYINSCIQVIYHIFMHYTEDAHFNNNREGYLVKGLVEGIYSDSRASLILNNNELGSTNFMMVLNSEMPMNVLVD